MTDLKTRFRNALSHPLTNISNYPRDVQVQLWGAQLTDLIDATADFIVEHGLISTEWEYAVEETKVGVGSVIVDNRWSPYLENCIASKDMLERFHRDGYLARTGKVWYTYRVVKRPKALPYEEVIEEEREGIDKSKLPL